MTYCVSQDVFLVPFAFTLSNDIDPLSNSLLSDQSTFTFWKVITGPVCGRFVLDSNVEFLDIMRSKNAVSKRNALFLPNNIASEICF